MQSSGAHAHSYSDSVEFSLPQGLKGRFAVVKLWPELQAAEDECIARIKIAARSLGLECVEVLADGTFIGQPEQRASHENMDFVLHLHYDTPKLYDAFSIVALWNPLHFYREWGYERCTRNLLSHDDFISCSSESADDHVKRLIHDHPSHLPPAFHLYHSLAGVVHPPSLGDGKLFYAGINWEAINGGKSRHGEVLKRLDDTGLLRIYGPYKFQDVQVWKGYKSYVREIPFDGTSMIDEIAKAGISLVLSSKAHKDAALMTNRLFEGIAAGALIICDENEWAPRFFGDSLLYVDTRCSVDDLTADIRAHLKWAQENPERALAKIARAQAIFTERFTLRRNLADLFSGLPARRERLRQNAGLVAGRPRLSVCTNYLMPTFSHEVLNRHLASAAVQTYADCASRLLVDSRTLEQHRTEIERAIEAVGIPIELMGINFFDHGPTGRVSVPYKTGRVLLAALQGMADADAFTVVAPNESLDAEHIGHLAAALLRNPEIGCAASAIIVAESNKPAHSVLERIAFLNHDARCPTGFGRFMLRTRSISDLASSTLPYLDRKCMAALVGNSRISQILPSSITVHVGQLFPFGDWNEGQENDILLDAFPSVMTHRSGVWPLHTPRTHPIAGPSAWLKLAKLMSPRWIKGQVRAIHRDGLPARMVVLRRKLGL